MLKPLNFCRKKTLFPDQLSIEMDLVLVLQKLCPQMPRESSAEREK